MIRPLTRNVALFVFALVGACVVVPEPMPDEQALKWREWRGSEDQVDVLLIGSSFLGTAVDPRRFAEETGLTLFNWGISAQFGWELDASLEAALSTDPERLKLVLVELSRANESQITEGTAREVCWHTLPRALAAWASSKDTRHLYIFARRVSPLGRAYLDEFVPDHLYVYRQGYMPRFAELDPDTRQRREFLREGLRVPERGAMNINRPLIDRLSRRAAEAGVQIRFVVPPNTFSGVPPRELGALDFNCPDKYARLFEPELRWDQAHLNTEGAAVFTPLLASALTADLRVAHAE